MNERRMIDALPCLEKAMAIECALKDDADLPTVANTNYFLGYHYNSAGGYEKAISNWESSKSEYNVIRDSGRPPWSKCFALNYADVLDGLGAVRLTSGNFTPALANMGLCAFYLGDTNKAIDYTERALSITLRQRELDDPAYRTLKKLRFTLIAHNPQKGSARTIDLESYSVVMVWMLHVPPDYDCCTPEAEVSPPGDPTRSNSGRRLLSSSHARMLRRNTDVLLPPEYVSPAREP